jgi:thiol-disulfide isomerase/thioredoxin
MKFPLFLICCLLGVTSAQAASQHTKGNKPLSISQGQEVNLTDFLVTGKTTVFEFTSEYCPPCRAFAEVLLQLHQQRADLAVVKVDINRIEVHKIDWQSPVARQYELQSIPFFKIVGPNGQLLAEGKPARDQVEAWIGQLQ